MGYRTESKVTYFCDICKDEHDQKELTKFDRKSDKTIMDSYAHLDICDSCMTLRISDLDIIFRQKMKYS